MFCDFCTCVDAYFVVQYVSDFVSSDIDKQLGTSCSRDFVYINTSGTGPVSCFMILVKNGLFVLLFWKRV